jgi:type I restriction enzyme S subunit
MSSPWPQQRVDDLIRRGILLINDGYRMRNDELGSSGVPFVRAADISGGAVRMTTEDFIVEKFRRNLESKFVKPGDVAFIAKGTVGRAGRVLPNSPPFVVAPQVCFWRSLNSNELDPDFLYYLLSGREFHNALDAVKTHGSMVADYVSLSDQKTFKLSIPPIVHQRRIGTILSSLDAKIELNRQTNETLETVARALFKSWFVDFDPVQPDIRGKTLRIIPDIAALFPGTLRQEENGAVPDGWQHGTMADIAGSPRRSINPRDVTPDTPYIGLEHMPRKSIALSEWGMAQAVSSGKLVFDRGDILFGKLRPYFHKVGIAPVNGVCSTDILVVTPIRPEYYGLALCYASSDAMIKHTDASSMGTKMPRTNWGEISRYPILVPPLPVTQTFNEILSPLIDQIIANVHEGRHLADLRDLLLPRLLSGDLQMQEAERAVGVVV